MNSQTIRKYLDTITTVLVVALFVGVAAFYLHGRFYKKQVDPEGSTVSKDLRIADALKFEYKTHSRTLILALDKDCLYCEKSAPFYKRLLELQNSSAANTQLIAALPNDDWEARQYLRKEGLEKMSHVANVNLSQLKINTLPTLVLVDRQGKVLESWSGQLDDARQQQVIESLSNRAKGTANSAAGTAATFSLFDSSKPSHTMSFDPNLLVNIVDVDSEGGVYVQNAGMIEKRDVDGVVKESVPIPNEVKAGAACAGTNGDFHFVLPQKILTSYRQGKTRATKEKVLPFQVSALSAKYDAEGGNVIILGNASNNSTEQTVYRFNLSSGELTPLHHAQLPITYNAAIGLGKLSYAIGPKRVFVSDPVEYKIFVYSLENNSLMNTFSQPFDRPAVSESDGKFESRNIVAEDLSQGGRLKNYPAIFNLDYVASKNLLLVWTSIRNPAHEQLIQIFDSELNAVGRDFKPTNPLFSAYHFAGNLVIAPDYGFGKEFHLDFLSPLEPAYYKPRSIKAFDLVAAKQ